MYKEIGILDSITASIMFISCVICTCFIFVYFDFFNIQFTLKIPMAVGFTWISVIWGIRCIIANFFKVRFYYRIRREIEFALKEQIREGFIPEDIELEKDYELNEC